MSDLQLLAVLCEATDPRLPRGRSVYTPPSCQRACFRLPDADLSLCACVVDLGEEHAAGMQVSRRVGLLHDQDLLDDAAQVPAAGLHAEGEIQPGRARGGHPRQPQQAAQVPQGEEHLPQAAGHRPGVHREVAQLLRGRPGDGQHGHAGPHVQQDGTAAQRLRPDVLRARLQHASVLARVAVQLQVPLVLLRQVQHLQREDRGVHV